MKKVLALVLVAILAFCLSGCASNFTPNKLIISQPSSYDLEEAVIEDREKIAQLWDYYVNLEYTGTTEELSENECLLVNFENTETNEYESFMIFSSGLVWFDENADEEESEYYYAAKGSEAYNTFYELLLEQNSTDEE